MKKFISLLLLAFLCSNISFSQKIEVIDKLNKVSNRLPYTPINDRCATMEALEYRMDNDEIFKQYQLAQRAIPSQSNQSKIACNGANSIIVPVAFHFANNAVSGNCANSDCLLTEVQDQLDALNAAYGDNTGTAAEAVCPAAYQDANGNSVASTGTCIEFCLAIPPSGGAANLDPTCDPPITVGVFTGGFSAGGNGAPGWDDILNIFITNGNCLGVADGIPGSANGDGVTVCSQAFGGTAGPAGCNLDDDNTFGLGATLIHEIGHYLGLYHTFQGGCGTQETNPPGPFDVLDTPAHSNSTSGCPNNCVTSGCGGGTFAPTANFMDYTNDACMSMFTEDQAQVQNYWANQLFGSVNAQCNANQNPTELTSLCLSQPCNVTCPSQVVTAYSSTDDVCFADGSYNLPTNFASVILDDNSDATYTWSTGNYLTAGGTAVTNSVALSPPSGCAPASQIIYLNVGCSDGSVNLNAGTLVLTVFPDPDQLALTDIVTFTNGACNGPTYVVTAGCEAYVTVSQNGGPAFPVTSGSGNVNYDVVLNYPVDCCSLPGGDILLTGTIPSTTLNAGNDTQACQSGTQPGIWEITFTVPTAQNATNVNTTGLGSIVEVCLDLTLNNTDAVNITLDSPDCGGYEWEDLWLGSAFTGGSNTGPVNVCFAPGTANGQFDGTFDGDDGTNGTFSTCDVNANQWVLYIADYNCYLNGATGGSINSATLVFNDGTQIGNPGLCDFTATASYDCTTTCADVDLSIMFDGFPGQTSWDITDANGAVMASGGTYGTQAANSTLSLTPACLPDGCYDLNFYDSINNGMCPFRSTAAAIGTFVTPGTLITPGSIVGTFGIVVTPGLCGSYTLIDANGSILANGGGSFGASETTQFCLSGGLSPRLGNIKNTIKDLANYIFEVNAAINSDFINVQYSDKSNSILRIVDISGKLIQEFDMTKNVLNRITIDLSQQETGVYFAQIITEDGFIETKKFFKK